MPPAAQVVPLTEEQKQAVEQNYTLVMWVVSNHRRKLISRDDMIEAASFGLIRAVRRYNPKIGEFSTYAAKAMRQCIMDAEMDRWVVHIPKYLLSESKKDHPFREYVDKARNTSSIHSRNSMCDSDALHPEVRDEYVDPDEGRLMKEAVDSAIRSLNKLERAVAEDLLLDGKAIDRVARENRRSRDAIRQAKCSARKKLRARLQRHA